MSRIIPENVIKAFCAIEKDPNRKKVFIAAEKMTLTYEALVRQVKKLIRFFREKGIGRNDKVVIASDNDCETMILFLSLLAGGITAVLIYPETKRKRALSFIRIVNPKCLFLDQVLEKDWDINTDEYNTVYIEKPRPSRVFNRILGKKANSSSDHSYPALLNNIDPDDLPGDIDPDTDAYIIFTSGTTSDPKGVRISNRALFDHLETLTRQFGYNDSSRILNILPLYHVDGLIQGPLAAFVNRATVYRPMRFEMQRLEELMDSVYTHRITHFVTVPAILSLMNQYGRKYQDSFTAPDFKFIILAAGMLEASLWQDFEEYFHVLVANVYGLTETVTGAIFSGPSDQDRRVGTIGKPSGCEVKIVDDSGDPVKAGETGELIIRGTNVMQGYFGNPEATNRVLKDGWLYTGDLAVCDEEGFYKIRGRKKTTIISGGLNIQPEEVREVMNSHPDITESVIFGIADPSWGEVAVGAVVVKQDSQVTRNDIIKFCREHLELFKVPKKIHILDTLPKGPSGKIIIPQVKKMLDIAGSPRDSGKAEDLTARVRAVAAEVFSVDADTMNPDSSPDNTAGWDSLDHLNLAVGLEKEFGITLFPAEIMNIFRLANAEEIIRKKLDGIDGV